MYLVTVAVLLKCKCCVKMHTLSLILLYFSPRIVLSFFENSCRVKSGYFLFTASAIGYEQCHITLIGQITKKYHIYIIGSPQSLFRFYYHLVLKCLSATIVLWFPKRTRNLCREPHRRIWTATKNNEKSRRRFMYCTSTDIFGSGLSSISCSWS